ncbi:alkaline phosphatase family protein [Butyricimonas sp.]|uniref:alkaline phosphatase family protein n=1 Tax=Butyricimonas sp. TaxID=1969738 RepID=UPI0025BD32D6|nr:alkaline phosphatase family protein [Butyricimonas sp.]
MRILVVRKLILLGLAFLAVQNVFAEGNKSKLVVGIVVSHFYPEWLDMYGDKLSENGLKRLVQQGLRVNANYNYMYTQTGVDHASIYTGMLPAEHGIVSRAWYDRLRRKRQFATNSDRYTEIGEQQADSIKSLAPDYLQTMSLGSAMKMNNPMSRVYSVAMNGDEAVLSGGSSADMAIWFSEKTGKWVSSTYYQRVLPDWLRAYNMWVESDHFVNKGWMMLSDEDKSAARIRLRNHFYYDIARAKREYNTYRVLKATPYGNTLVRVLAEKLIDAERLGEDNDPDLLAVNFSCLDYMYRDFAIDSEEEKDMLIRLDMDVAELLRKLDAKVGKGNYTVFMTFSETRELMPEDLRKIKVNSDYFSIFRAVALLKSYLALIYGPGDWIADYDQGQIYLNRGLIEERKLEVKEVQDKVADFMIEFEGVAKVMTAYSLIHTSFPDGMNRLVQNSFSHKRSGDVLFCIHPTWVSELKEMEDTYFRHSKRSIVPLYLYGAGVKPGIKEDAMMSDLLPTLCKILGIRTPYTAHGKSMQ